MSYGISGQVFVITCFFSVIIIDGFKWFWMGSLHKNIQLMLYFLKAPFLALHLSKYTLMIFMMLCVILLSMPMILLSNLTVIRHMICGNNYSWLLNLNLIYEKLWTGAGSDSLISMLERFNWFHLKQLQEIKSQLGGFLQIFVQNLI